jgi:hypothetical protein
MSSLKGNDIGWIRYGVLCTDFYHFRNVVFSPIVTAFFASVSVSSFIQEDGHLLIGLFYFAINRDGLQANINHGDQRTVARMRPATWKTIIQQTTPLKQNPHHLHQSRSCRSLKILQKTPWLVLYSMFQ